MRPHTPRLTVIFAALTLSTGAAHAQTTAPASPACATATPLGVSRIVEIDTSTGALFGAISRQAKEPRFLEPKEVILTFDDGPMPAVTRNILDTLDQFCTKATFFQVGQMAIAYPATVKSILSRGHTIGTHTWSHPMNLKHLPREKAIDEIEKGFAAVTLAAGQPIAPFFRFPGLSDSAPLLAHLQERGIASFTVDAVSDDSYISDPQRLLQHALAEVEAQKGGIVLFHDIKPATARMLPHFLSELRARGYHIVHMIPKSHVEPLAIQSQHLLPLLEKTQKAAAANPLLPFYGALKPSVETDDAPRAEAVVTAIAPAPRDRAANPHPVKIDKPKSLAATSLVGHSTNEPTKTAVQGWLKRTD